VPTCLRRRNTDDNDETRQPSPALALWVRCSTAAALRFHLFGLSRAQHSSAFSFSISPAQEKLPLPALGDYALGEFERIADLRLPKRSSRRCWPGLSPSNGAAPSRRGATVARALS